MLEKTRAIFEIDENWDGRAGQYFEYKMEEIPRKVERDLYICQELWEELGSPKKLTVTIEPGDKLNDA